MKYELCFFKFGFNILKVLKARSLWDKEQIVPETNSNYFFHIIVNIFFYYYVSRIGLLTVVVDCYKLTFFFVQTPI